MHAGDLDDIDDNDQRDDTNTNNTNSFHYISQQANDFRTSAMPSAFAQHANADPARHSTTQQQGSTFKPPGKLGVIPETTPSLGSSPSLTSNIPILQLGSSPVLRYGVAGRGRYKKRQATGDTRQVSGASASGALDSLVAAHEKETEVGTLLHCDLLCPCFCVLTCMHDFECLVAQTCRLHFSFDTK